MVSPKNPPHSVECGQKLSNFKLHYCHNMLQYSVTLVEIPFSQQNNVRCQGGGVYFSERPPAQVESVWKFRPRGRRHRLWLHRPRLRLSRHLWCQGSEEAAMKAVKQWSVGACSRKLRSPGRLVRGLALSTGSKHSHVNKHRFGELLPLPWEVVLLR